MLLKVNSDMKIQQIRIQIQKSVCFSFRLVSYVCSRQIPLKTTKKRCSSVISLPPATKLGQGYVFTGMCDSVHKGGSAPVHAGIPPPCPVADTPLGVDTPSVDTPRADTPTHRACWEIRSMHRVVRILLECNLVFTTHK